MNRLFSILLVGFMVWESDRLRQDRPELRVICTSGYSSEVAGKDLTRQQGMTFLQKPYLPEKLIQMVRACLDGN